MRQIARTAKPPRRRSDPRIAEVPTVRPAPAPAPAAPAPAETDEAAEEAVRRMVEAAYT
jgi:hypothetical protein